MLCGEDITLESDLLRRKRISSASKSMAESVARSELKKSDRGSPPKVIDALDRGAEVSSEG